MLRRNVLIFHSGALGDFVLSWPVAMAVGRVLAQSRVIYVAARQKGLLAETVLRVESADAELGWHALYGDGGGLPEGSRKLLAGAAVVIAFGEPGERWVGNVRAVNPEARMVLLRARPAEGAAAHAVDDLLAQLEGDRVLHEAARQMVQVVRSRGLINPWPGEPRRVLVHPGSGGERKCWGRDRFLGVIEALKSRWKDVRVVMGEVEMERWSAAERGAFEQVAPVRVTATYLDLLGEIRGAGVFVGNDSGPGHLAATCGAKVVSIFTATDPAVWAPVGPRVTVLKSPAVDDVVAAVE